jgi:hypothetical protein
MDQPIDPKTLEPGQLVRWRTSAPQELKERKADGSGWWMTDGSGLDDFAWESGDWTVGRG